MMRMTKILLAVLLAAAAAGRADAEFSNEKLSFSVSVRGETNPYRVLAVSVLPEKTLTLEIVKGSASGAYEASAKAGTLRSTAPNRWEWRAPAEVGLYPLTVRSVDSGESMQLNMFVIVPLNRVKDGKLNGYRIDAYPTVPLKGLEIYKPPRGLIEVTEANVDTQLSPHFTLRQFLCKQTSDYPKYVIVRERLLLKLELLLEQVNAAGFHADTFFVMSGYRTPFYNRSIGNVKYSRHVYGGAADIFIDQDPRDGMMDDLDGNGKIDVYDAGVLYNLIDELYGKESYKKFTGGLGRYKKNPVRGPFVHVDVRGFRARWGD